MRQVAIVVLSAYMIDDDVMIVTLSDGSSEAWNETGAKLAVRHFQQGDWESKPKEGDDECPA